MKLRSRRLDTVDDRAGEEEDASTTTSEETSEDFVLVKNRRDEAAETAAHGIKGDEHNIAVLLFLYVLQGIPLGLAAAVPLILSNRHVSYREQAEFSFAYWPFSIKLLWAPVVDSCFVATFGRRKTWLVPVQVVN